LASSAGVEPVDVPWPGAPVLAVQAWRRQFPLRLPRWGLGDAAIALLGAFVTSLTVGFLLLVNKDSTQWQNIVILLSLAAQWVPMFGWPMIATRVKGNGPRLDLGFAVGRDDLVWGAGGGLVALALAGLIGLITEKFAGTFNSSAGELMATFKNDTLLLILLSLCIAIGAPIVEELAFRGLLWGSLAKRGLNPWIVTVITAAIFAGFHVEPVRFPLLFVTGLVLGYLRQRTGGLGASMIAHAINNSAGVLGLFLLPQ